MINKKLIKKYEREKPATTFLSAVIDPEDKVTLKKSAAEHNISVSFLLRIIIKEYLTKNVLNNEVEI